MGHSCSHIPLLDVIVPTLVSRRETFAFKVWLDKWKVTACICVRVIAVLDSNGSAESEVDAFEKELLDDLPVTKKLLTPRGFFGSPGAARNMGLSQSLAKWIIFWDADDSPEFTIMNSVLERLDKSKNSIHVYQYDSWSIDKQEVKIAARDESILTLARYPGLWRMIIPGDCARRLTFTNYLMGEDVTYLIQLLTSGNVDGVKFFSEKLYRYNIYSKGQLTTSKSALKDLVNSLELMSQLLRGRVENISSNKNLALLIYLFQCLSLLKKQPLLTLKRSFKILSTIFSRSNSKLPRVSIKHSGGASNQEVFVYAMGGLGNQLFQYAAACYYAADDSRVKIITDAGSPRLDTSGLPILSAILETPNRRIDFIEIGRHQLLFSRLANTLLRININERVFLNNPIVRKSVAILFEPIFSILLGTRVKLLVCHEHGFSKEKKIRSCNLLVIGYFQSHVYAEAIKDEIKKKLVEVAMQTIYDKIDVYKDRLPKVLTIHIRRGDYLAEPKIGCLTDEYFIQAYKKISKENYEEVWVMVEDQDSARILEKDMSANTRVFTSVDFTTIETLALMTLGSGHIISNSTFSWWGAYLSENRHSRNRVIAPTPWYRKIKHPKQLLPENWEHMNSDWIIK